LFSVGVEVLTFIGNSQRYNAQLQLVIHLLGEVTASVSYNAIAHGNRLLFVNSFFVASSYTVLGGNVSPI
jgi:hypothetical protein